MSAAAKPSAATRTHRLLGDPSRARILQILEGSARPLAAAEVADQVWLHPTTARFHLELLADAGLVERSTEVRTARGRPRRLYGVATTPPAPEGSYQMLAEMLAERLAGPGGVASATHAGVEWGRRLQPASATPVTAPEAVRRLRDILQEAGFAPSVSDRGDLVLRECPFIAVARRNPDVVCGVHLGLARGVLQQLGAPLEAAALKPSFEGPPCLLRLEETSS